MNKPKPAPARAAFVDAQVPGWLAARRYGVSEHMVAGATERRLAGDWRGACAEARVDITFNPGDITDGYGTETADRLADDLRHLVPDLVRWHLPRQTRGSDGLLFPGSRAVLARYGGDLALYIAAPAHPEWPQRLTLHCGELPRGAEWNGDWTGARYLWDSRATHLLLARVGGGDRAPFFDRDGRRRTPDELADDPVSVIERVIGLQDDGQVARAWAEGGVDTDFTDPEPGHGTDPRYLFFEPMGAMVPVLAPVARQALTGCGAPEAVVLRGMYSWGRSAVELRLIDGRLSATMTDWYPSRHLPALPRPAWQRFPDVELLRTGEIGTSEVHPLVRAALFPDEPDPGFQHRLPNPLSATVRVRCRGEWHHIGWRGGRVTAMQHTEEEAKRERVIRSLGGAVPACFTVTDTWRGTVSGRLPRAMRKVRAHVLTVLTHGRTELLVRLLDEGLDPTGIHDGSRRGPLHHLAKFDGEPLLRRLLDAGLDINARDLRGGTPLAQVLSDGGGASLVRAMLDAGADPTMIDERRATTLHVLRSTDAAQIVPWLVAAGVDPNSHDAYRRPPLIAQFQNSAPAEVMRATVAAGADPAAIDTYRQEGIIELINRSNRTDLGFLVDAAKAAIAAKDDR